MTVVCTLDIIENDFFIVSFVFVYISRYILMTHNMIISYFITLICTSQIVLIFSKVLWYSPFTKTWSSCFMFHQSRWISVCVVNYYVCLERNQIKKYICCLFRVLVWFKTRFRMESGLILFLRNDLLFVHRKKSQFIVKYSYSKFDSNARKLKYYCWIIQF